MPANERPSEKPHPRDRRSQGEEYPGHGDAGSLEEQYGTPEPPEPEDDDADRDEKGEGT